MGETEGKTGFGLMGGAMLSKSLIQFSVDGWNCVPSLLFTWGQTMVEVMKIMATFFKRSHACTATVHAPNPTAGHHRPTPSPETPRHPQAMGQSPGGGGVTAIFSWVPGTQGSVVPSKSLFPRLVKVLASLWCG